MGCSLFQDDFNLLGYFGVGWTNVFYSAAQKGGGNSLNPNAARTALSGPDLLLVSALKCVFTVKRVF